MNEAHEGGASQHPVRKRKNGAIMQANIDEKEVITNSLALAGFVQRCICVKLRPAAKKRHQSNLPPHAQAKKKKNSRKSTQWGKRL